MSQAICFIYIKSFNFLTSTRLNIIFILKMKKLRFNKNKLFAGKRWSWNSSPSLLGFKIHDLNTTSTTEDFEKLSTGTM